MMENELRVEGVRFCYFEQGRALESEPTYLLIHATGFHARCWDQTIAHLGNAHVIALDMRGHGRSDNSPPYTWEQFGTDVLDVTEALQLTKVVGVGHSMGGHSVLQAAAASPERFQRLVLIDPVILNPDEYASHAARHKAWLTEDGEHPVARRKNWFESVRAMVDNFTGRGAYGLWQKEVLDDYCRYGLLADPTGDGFVLACPPSVEAQIYMGSSGTDVHLLPALIEIPVTVLRARPRLAADTQMDFSASPTWPALANEFPKGRDVDLSHLTHFIPMQDPALTAGYILDET